MDRLIYTSLSAMRGSMARQTAIANNLANAQTTGFRGDIARAQSLWLDGQGFDARAVSADAVVGADMGAGAVIKTGRALDIALARDAMLAVQSPSGDEGYTRRGDLVVGASGLLTTGDGNPVLGQQGPIIVPPADALTIAPDGRIMFVPSGSDGSPPQALDQLRLVSPAGADVVKGLDGLFRVRGGGILPNDPEAQLNSGMLEGSNVNPTAALVEMIEASKAWDAQLKLIGSARDLDSASANLMQLPG